MGSNEKAALIKRLSAYIENTENEEYFQSMFSLEEQNILQTVAEFEKMRWKHNEKLKEISSMTKSRKIDTIFQIKEQERVVSFKLREQLIEQMNSLLRQRSINAWMDILTWYHLLKHKKLAVDKFWEFFVLEIMLKAFYEELKLMDMGRGHVSVLLLCSMEELTETYYKIVFLLRRIEYDVEPNDEILYFMAEKKISLTVIETILHNSQIYNIKKIERALESWMG